jgi:predicted enzyme related to lactoylglutathione lyase
MSPSLHAITPFFIVRDLARAVAYYRDQLGFALDFDGPAEGAYFARVSRDGVGIMLKAVHPDVPPMPNPSRHTWARWDAYVSCDDPDALYREFSARGATFVRDLAFIDDGLWGFEVRDADGYVIAFLTPRDA